MHRFRLRSLVAFGSLTAAVLTIVLLSAGSASAAGWPDGPWTGSGTATTTVTSDGTSSNPVFDYSVNGTQGTWTFSANAKTGRTQPIVWHYKGYHAWFQVTVQIQQFVIHNGQETDTTLRSAGPVNCCSAPSGGFDYAGTAAFNLQAGDVYGFHMSGSNADSDRRLIGTLSLSAPVSATNPGNQAGTVGVASSLQLAATGGTSPYTWSATGLPAGLSLNPSTGVISGTPSAAGAFTVTVTATDAATPTHTTDSATFTWTISAPVSASNPGNQAGTVGLASSLQLAATGGTSPYTWSATGLPAGLSLNPSSGAISGTPTTAGTSTVTVTVSDAVHRSDSKTFTWTINPPTGGGCSSPGQKLANPGFESGTAPWTTTASVINANGSGQSAHSGTHFAWLDGYGTTHTDTLSQLITIPAGCSTYTLSFFLHVDTGETTTSTQFDKLTVQLGSQTLATYSNLDHTTGYVQRSFSVNPAPGTNVTLKFTGAEDSSLQTSFVIDDIALTVS